MTSPLPAALACLLSVSLSAQLASVKKVSIESKPLGQTRELLIYEPLNYTESQHTYYDVLYVFDAQQRSLFDYASSVAQLTKGEQQGFVVVGVMATFDRETMYGRNHDLIPSDSKWRLGPTPPNAENFLAYIQEEVVPYVESRYRVLRHRTAIGHSLSASFLVYAMLQDADLFDNILAISPNLAYDKQRLVQGLRGFDSKQFETPRLFYLSHADENVGDDWPGWPRANKAAYEVAEKSLANDNFRVVVEQFPEESHMSGYMPAVRSAMKTLLGTIRPLQVTALPEKLYEITVSVNVPAEADEIYIAGNQRTLGKGTGERVAMEKVAPRVRRATLKVQDHAEMRFFRAPEGDAQAWIRFGEEGQSTFPVMIRPKQGAAYTFDVVRYTR